MWQLVGKATYGEFDTGLVGWYDGKDVVFCSGEDTFEDGKIGNHTASVEILGTTKSEMVTFVHDTEVVVSWVHRAFLRYFFR